MHKVFICLFLVSVLLVSCDSKRVFDEYQSLPDGWHRDSLVSFDFNNPDTTKVYDLFINIRNNNEYPFSNLYLITEMNFPNGKTIADTLEYEMAYPNGDWMGEGFTDVKESKLWYRENVRFGETGEYTLNIRHAMRKNGEVDGVQVLEGITDVGFRIEASRDE
jgi:gliding motility-associated lipoprotein GldH